MLLTIKVYGYKNWSEREEKKKRKKKFNENNSLFGKVAEPAKKLEVVVVDNHKLVRP